MPYCTKCGKKNDDDAEYCNKCGNYIGMDSSFEKDIDEFAEKIGRKAEELGERIGKKAEEIGKSVKEAFSSEPKYCSDCKIELKDDALYCWKCGNKIE
jgi:uncharacterized membrane protein YvbJ